MHIVIIKLLIYVHDNKMPVLFKHVDLSLI